MANTILGYRVTTCNEADLKHKGHMSDIGMVTGNTVCIEKECMSYIVRHTDDEGESIVDAIALILILANIKPSTDITNLIIGLDAAIVASTPIDVGNSLKAVLKGLIGVCEKREGKTLDRVYL